jgi:transposase
MKAYSQDLRLRILRAVDAGQTKAAVARRFEVALSTVKLYLAQRAAGPDRPKGVPGPAPRIPPADLPAVAAQVRAQPDATLAEHATRWEQEHGVRVSPWTMGRAIRRLGLTRKKKTLTAAEQDADLRATFRLDLALNLDPADLVSVDEAAVTCALTRLYARSPKGERAIGCVPRNHGTPTTLVTALAPDGIQAAMSLPGPLDALAGRVFAQDVLGPTLRPGQVVAVDNLSVHLDPQIQAAIAERGCLLIYLPAYSPDLAPVELALAKIKAKLREIAARTQAALDAGIARALETITPEDARGFFKHAGYPLPA